MRKKLKKKACNVCGRGGSPATRKLEWDGRLLTPKTWRFVSVRGIANMDDLLNMDLRSFVSGRRGTPKILDELIRKAQQYMNR